MSNLKTSQEVLETINQKVSQSKYFSGIEIAAYKQGETYTDDVCIRVLVNESSITHEDLNIPHTLKDIPILVEKRIIEPL